MYPKRSLRNGLWLALLAAGPFLFFPMLSGCATLGADTQGAVIRAKHKVAPALVHIRPTREVFRQGKREEVLVLGSGFIISPDGYVITNEHVAGKSTLVRCVLSTKEEVEAEVVGADPYTDVAVLKLNMDHPLPYVALGSSAKLEAGEVVLALGSPHGLERSVSLGIVSVVDRHLDSSTRVAPFNNWIQTDAAINPGNSGGPLVNLHGKVVGVNARMLRGAENVGFAIPIDVAREVSEEIIAHGRVRRSWIGINLQEMLARTEDPTQRGVVIADVDPLSPAREAGVQPGDILLSVNGAPSNARFEEDLPAVRKLVADLPVGEAATLEILRNGERAEVEVTTEERSALEGEEIAFEDWGFTATELTPQMVRRAQLPSRQGIFVSGKQVGGAAGEAGLERGDIILEVDGIPVDNLAHFRSLYQDAVGENKPKVMLWVKRGALTRFVLVQQEPEQEPVVMPGDRIDEE